MRAARIPDHWQLLLEPREADTLRGVLSDLLDDENREKFGLNELEEEVLRDIAMGLADSE